MNTIKMNWLFEKEKKKIFKYEKNRFYNIEKSHFINGNQKKNTECHKRKWMNKKIDHIKINVSSFKF